MWGAVRCQQHPPTTWEPGIPHDTALVLLSQPAGPENVSWSCWRTLQWTGCQEKSKHENPQQENPNYHLAKGFTKPGPLVHLLASCDTLCFIVTTQQLKWNATKRHKCFFICFTLLSLLLFGCMSVFVWNGGLQIYGKTGAVSWQFQTYGGRGEPSLAISCFLLLEVNVSCKDLC